jgi:3-phosphoshikimate 1-carboxyvinyltransferase
MDITIFPGKLQGEIAVIPSKSQAHRMLICAAFADKPTTLICPETSRDMDATANCLQALGARIYRSETGYHVIPAENIPQQADLPCRDSGSTLRFMLPVVGALGVDATFYPEGRLAQRPLSPLWEEMHRMGCCLSRPSENTIRCTDKLTPGIYHIDGGISSQFITGLLLALPLLKAESRICITGKLESKPYIDMTCQAMGCFGIASDNYILSGKGYTSQGIYTIEGDWSNSAFFLAANTLGSNIQITNLSENSPQGDKVCRTLLNQLTHPITISAADIPDLIPILSVVAAHNQGAAFTDIQRLRLKESDRVATVIAMLHALGGSAEATEDTLTVHGTGLSGGIVDAYNDHRIAMSAAIASTVCRQNVTIHGSECVQKSYPRFWEEFQRLGGNYEQHIW